MLVSSSLKSSSYWLASQMMEMVMEMKVWRASEADVRDALTKDIEENGERSRFVLVGDDEFALRSWEEHSVQEN